MLTPISQMSVALRVAPLSDAQVIRPGECVTLAFSQTRCVCESAFASPEERTHVAGDSWTVGLVVAQFLLVSLRTAPYGCGALLTRSAE